MRTLASLLTTMLYSGLMYSSQDMNLEDPILDPPVWKSLWNDLLIKLLLLKSTYSNETSASYFETSSSASKCIPRNSPFLSTVNFQLMSSLLNSTQSIFNSLTPSNLIPTLIKPIVVGRPWALSTVAVKKELRNNYSYASKTISNIENLFDSKILPKIQKNNKDKRFILKASLNNVKSNWI